MNNKNEESKRAFVPKTIGDSLKRINRDFSNKYGKIEYLIITKWPKIVGPFFANHSEPNKISRIPDGENDNGDVIYNNNLHINVSPVAAVEFQHFKDKIIEKINKFSVEIETENKVKGTIEYKDISWTKKEFDELFKIGDVIYVKKIKKKLSKLLFQIDTFGRLISF